MADNISVKDSSGASVVVRAKDNSSIYTPFHYTEPVTTTARLASSAASTNATRVKSAAGSIYGIQGYNAAAYPVYLVLYDSTANPPVPGSTTIRKKIPLPGGAVFTLMDGGAPHLFATGIGYAFTLNAADADTTAIASGDILAFNMDYI